MDLTIPQPLLEADRPIRRAVRRMRWFKRSFAAEVEAITKSAGVVYRLDNDRLAQSYVAWVRAFEARKPATEEARRGYTNFASGLMLRELVTRDPLEAVTIPATLDPGHPASFWPEGYAYVGYCLNVRGAVLAQDFGETLKLSHDLIDIRTWWSFRENVAEDPAFAIPFLDHIAGETPNWEFPDSPGLRLAAPAKAIG